MTYKDEYFEKDYHIRSDERYLENCSNILRELQEVYEKEKGKIDSSLLNT